MKPIERNPLLGCYGHRIITVKVAGFFGNEAMSVQSPRSGGTLRRELAAQFAFA